MLYIDQVQVDWTLSLVLKNPASKIYGAQSELPE